MRSRKVIGMALLGLMLVAQAALAQGRETYSMLGEFSLANNPSRTWSYGYTQGLGGVFQPFTTSGPLPGGQTAWLGPFESGAFPFVRAPGLLHAFPYIGHYAVVRWTSPTHGQFRVGGRFIGVTPATTDVHILRNGIAIFDEDINGQNDLVSFDLLVRVAEGDTIDFAVGPGPNDHNQDATGIRAVINGYTMMTIEAPGAISTTPRGINARGDVSGHYVDTQGKTHGFLMSGGNYTTLDFPGASLTQAVGIGDEGTIAGSYFDTSGMQHGFLWENGNFSTLDFPGAVVTAPGGITPSGQIVGAYRDPAATLHGFSFERGVFQTLDFPGATSTQAIGGNAPGEIVGLYVDGAGKQHGFYLRTGNFETVDFPNSRNGVARSINPRGDIAGGYQNLTVGGAQGFLLLDGEYFAVSHPGARGSTVRAINTHGEFVGEYTDFAGVTRGYVALPLPR